MKKQIGKIIAISLIFLFAMTATPAIAKKDVVLERIETENIMPDDYNLWGPKVSELTSSNGAYGGILGSGGDARLISYPGCTDSAYYTFTYKGSARTLFIRHLDGKADDGFNVYAIGNQGQEILIGTYEDEPDEYDPEVWYTSIFSLKPAIPHLGHGHSITIKIELTGAHWNGYNTWGQLAIDWMELKGNGK